MATRWMPVTIKTGRAAAAVPPGTTIRKATLAFSYVPKDAWIAAIIVTVAGAEAIAVLVDALIGTSDGITFGQSWSLEFRRRNCKCNLLMC